LDVNNAINLSVKASTNPFGITINLDEDLLNATIPGNSINIPLQTTPDTITWLGLVR
jgi:hypothetical protein